MSRIKKILPFIGLTIVIGAVAGIVLIHSVQAGFDLKYGEIHLISTDAAGNSISGTTMSANGYFISQLSTYPSSVSSNSASSNPRIYQFWQNMASFQTYAAWQRTFYASSVVGSRAPNQYGYCFDDVSQSPACTPSTWNTYSGSSVGITIPSTFPSSGNRTRVVFRYLPTASVTADSTSIPYNGSTMIRWSSTYASSCTGTNFQTNGATSGAVSTGNLTSSKTYTVTCTNSSSSANASVTVNVAAPLSYGQLYVDVPVVDASGNTISPRPTGAGVTIAQVPPGTAIVTPTSSYPATVNNLQPSGTSYYFGGYNDLPDYTETINGYCQYQIGNVQCSAYTPLAAGNTLPITANMVTKVKVTYTYNQRGDVVVKRVDDNLNLIASPTTYYIDAVAQSSSNPGTTTNILAGNHTVGSTQLSGYTVKAAYCQYNKTDPAPCFLSNNSDYTITPTCSGSVCTIPTVPVTTNMITKVAFRYTPIPPTFAKLYFFGQNLATSSAPAGAGGQVMLITPPTSTYPASTGTNPKVYTIPPGTFAFVATSTAVSGYTTSVGVCSYSGSATDCSPPSYSTASCSNDVCSQYMTPQTGTTTKIIFKYDPVGATYNLSASDPDVIVTRGYSTANTIFADPVNGWLQPITFSVSGLPAGATASFSPTSCTPRCATILTVNTTSSTPTGTSTITVTGSPLGRTTTFQLVVSASFNASLRVCTVFVNSDDVIATSSIGLPAGSFSITAATTTNIAATTFRTTSFTASGFTPNAKVLNASVNDAQCVTYTGLPFRAIYYGEEQVTGATPGTWTVKYNDQNTTAVTSLSTFYEYDNALFTSAPEDDADRNMNSDGHITFGSTRQDRTLVVLNEYPAPQNGSFEIKRVDESLNLFSSTAYFDAASVGTANPWVAGTSTVSIGTHTAGVSEVSGYTITAAACQNTEGASNCPLSDPSKYTETVTCSGGICSVSQPVSAGMKTRVVFKYTAVTTPPPPPPPPPTTQVLCYASPSVARANERVTWSAVVVPSGSYSYLWNGAGITGQTSQKVTVSGGYSLPGGYAARVTVSGITSPPCGLTVVKNSTFQEF